LSVRELSSRAIRATVSGSWRASSPASSGEQDGQDPGEKHAVECSGAAD
jgi:hypothetical protein